MRDQTPGDSQATETIDGPRMETGVDAWPECFVASLTEQTIRPLEPKTGDWVPTASGVEQRHVSSDYQYAKLAAASPWVAKGRYRLSVTVYLNDTHAAGGFSLVFANVAQQVWCNVDQGPSRFGVGVAQCQDESCSHGLDEATVAISGPVTEAIRLTAIVDGSRVVCEAATTLHGTPIEPEPTSGSYPMLIGQLAPEVHLNASRRVRFRDLAVCSLP